MKLVLTCAPIASSARLRFEGARPSQAWKPDRDTSSASHSQVTGQMWQRFVTKVTDPRQRGKVLYPLPEIMLLILCGTPAGAGDFVEIREGGASEIE